MPHREGVPSQWRLKGKRYLLVGKKCVGCAGVFFPNSLEVCGSCGSNLIDFRLGGLGVVETHTKIHAAPPGFTTPYAVGIVRLDEGVRITTNFVGDVGVGDRVGVVFRKQTENKKTPFQYGFKFSRV